MSASTSNIPSSSNFINANDSAGQIFDANSTVAGAGPSSSRKGKEKESQIQLIVNEPFGKNAEPLSPVSSREPTPTTEHFGFQGPVSPVSPVSPGNALVPELRPVQTSAPLAAPGPVTQANNDDQLHAISVTKPNLVNPHEYDQILELPEDHKSIWAQRFQKADWAQKKQEEEWTKLSKMFGQKIDPETLKLHHTSYLEAIKPFNKTLTNINKKIMSENQKSGRGTDSGVLVPIPLRGPSLEKLQVATLSPVSKSTDEGWNEKGSRIHWDAISNTLTWFQKERLAPIWSLCTALILHRNAIMTNHVDYFDEEFNDDIVHILKKQNKEVTSLFSTNVFQGSSASEIRLQYTNFAKIKLPKFETPAQRVFNVAEEFNVEDEDEEDEDNDEVMAESEYEIPDPPAEVQALRERLGGWNGLLSQWLQAQFDNVDGPNGFDESIREIDNSVAELCASQGVSHDFSITTLLPKILQQCQLLYLDPKVKNIAQRNNAFTEEDWNMCQVRVAGLRGTIDALKAPKSFADAMIPPTLINKDNDNAQGTKRLKYEELLKGYQSRIGGLTGTLKRYLDEGLRPTKIAALRKLKEEANLFKRECEKIGVSDEAQKELVIEEKLQEYEEIRTDLDQIRAEALKDHRNDQIQAKLAELRGQVQGNVQATIAIAIIGDEKKFNEELKRLKVPKFTPIVIRNNTGDTTSRFVTPNAWKSPPGVIIDNGIEKKIVGFRSVGHGEQLLLEWRNEGAKRNAFELVAASVYKHKRKEYTGGRMEIGKRFELENYLLSDCGFGGVAQVRRRDNTTSFIRAPATYIFISHKGVEKWFTKSDMISAFGDQIKDVMEEYNRDAHQTQVTGNNAWKNSRRNGWKDSTPLNDSSNVEHNDEFITLETRKPMPIKSVMNNDNYISAEERREFEEFKELKRNGGLRAGRA